MFAKSRVNWFILRTSVEERLVYRGDFAFATLVRFLPIVTQIFLWGAIYANSPEPTLNSFTYANMVAYYLFAMLSRAFSSMPGLTSGIARDVRDGTIKKYLTQPIDMLGYLFWHRIAHKLVYYIVAAGPFALVFWLCRDYFDAWPHPLMIACWIASLFLGFLVGFLIESLLGMVSFWFLEVSSLVFIYMMINYFLSGHMIPLDWLPEWMHWVHYLPFKYLAYFPASIMLRKSNGEFRYSDTELLTELAIELCWVIGLLIACRIAFSCGVKRYGAFGG
ncbi:MAG: ABC-2 family transporter protein [Planctomycetota bacterium]|nr:ABC-2 family transporter protein [Planctomycetota bacterium]